jgi:hypothetical protein
MTSDSVSPDPAWEGLVRSGKARVEIRRVVRASKAEGKGRKDEGNAQGKEASRGGKDEMGEVVGESEAAGKGSKDGGKEAVMEAGRGNKEDGEEAGRDGNEEGTEMKGLSKDERMESEGSFGKASQTASAQGAPFSVERPADGGMGTARGGGTGATAGAAAAGTGETAAAAVGGMGRPVPPSSTSALGFRAEVTGATTNDATAGEATTGDATASERSKAAGRPIIEPWIVPPNAQTSAYTNPLSPAPAEQPRDVRAFPGPPDADRSPWPPVDSSAAARAADAETSSGPQTAGGPQSAVGAGGLRRRAVRLRVASCCLPVPGDPVCGVLQPSGDLLVHRDCCRIVHGEAGGPASGAAGKSAGGVACGAKRGAVGGVAREAGGGGTAGVPGAGRQPGTSDGSAEGSAKGAAARGQRAVVRWGDEWSSAAPGSRYSSRLKLSLDGDSCSLAAICAEAEQAGAAVAAYRLSRRRAGGDKAGLTLEVQSLAQLLGVVRALRTLPGVRAVERV